MYSTLLLMTQFFDDKTSKSCMLKAFIRNVVYVYQRYLTLPPFKVFDDICTELAMAILQFFNGKPPEEQGPNSIEKCWLETRLETRIDIPF